ncbi:unnamed protein product [Arctia plantaginis]|uniref:Uncharacterized protein n=1 Tax=Arctia plantaginis TaxID=874455 RepID=A0A8S1A877_ARCPL|nr:unnamed protein product [Arctia plantaginis]CAB3242684.1 unnamed protein product [Arctia plantaginis]
MLYNCSSVLLSTAEEGRLSKAYNNLGSFKEKSGFRKNLDALLIERQIIAEIYFLDSSKLDGGDFASIVKDLKSKD